ncbi:MAG TPA: hypothetical protein PKE39_03655 [Ignavibacteria bacterium]|nr:hypothetical protein [Ignavibacteria bacterium]HMQ98096.1 hypothetical protein [Ignavibacteria bacterium]
MLNINKNYIVDENQVPIAVQIPIDEFEAMESTIENFGLSKLMDESINDESFEKTAAIEYYNTLKKNVED